MMVHESSLAHRLQLSLELESSYNIPLVDQQDDPNISFGNGR